MATIPMTGFAVSAAYNTSIPRQKTQSTVNDSPPFAQFAAKETNQGRPATGREKERLFHAIQKNDSSSAAQDAKGKTVVQLPQKQEQRANVVQTVEKDNQTSNQPLVNSGRTIQDDIQSAITRGVMAVLAVIKNNSTETVTTSGQAVSQTGTDGTQVNSNLTVDMASAISVDSAATSMGSQSPPQSPAASQPLLSNEELARLAEAQTKIQGTFDALLANLEKSEGKGLDNALAAALDALKSLQNADSVTRDASEQIKQILTDVSQKIVGSMSQDSIQTSGSEDASGNDTSKIKNTNAGTVSIDPSWTRELKSISVDGSSGGKDTQQNDMSGGQQPASQSTAAESDNLPQTSSARVLFTKTLREASVHMDESVSGQASQNAVKNVQIGSKSVPDTAETFNSVKVASSQTKAKEVETVEIKTTVKSQDGQTIAISMPTVQRAEVAVKTAELNGTQNILSQTLTNVEDMVQNGQKSLRVQLHPENLGNLELRLTSQNGSLQVVILADSSMTQQVLERHAHDLQQMLIQSGVNLAGLTVGQRGANEANSGNNSRTFRQNRFTGGQPIIEDALEGVDGRLKQVDQNMYYQYLNTADYASPYVDYRV